MATFVERTTAPLSSNPKFFADNPFYQAGYGMPNCTAYAYGRYWEVIGQKPTGLSLGDAETWYTHSDSYPRSQTPTLGAILCLKDGPWSGRGHVAIVEQIFDNGDIFVSESAYQGYFWKREVIRKSKGYLPIGGYIFQGFILPIDIPDPPHPPVPPYSDKQRMPLYFYNPKNSIRIF